MQSTFIKVLLVEPDLASAREIREYASSLTSGHLQLGHCGRLAEALQRLAAEQYDAILLSLTIPDCDWVSALDKVHAHAPTLPLIILAGRENEAVALEAVRRGAQDYLVRSKCDGRILSRVVRHAIARKRIEEALRESERQYKRLLDSTTDYIYTVQVENGRSVAATHGPGCLKVTGYSPDDYAQDPFLWVRMAPPDDQPRLQEQIATVLAGQEPPPLEHRIHHKDGSIRWVRNTVVPRKCEQGRMTSYDGLITDITERKVTEIQLRQTNAELVRANAELTRSEDALRQALQDLKASHEELKATQMQLIQAGKMECIGTLAAGVAHEVKNPLQVVLMGVAYLAKNVHVQDENISLTLSDMRDAIKRANSIVHGLLDFSAAGHLDMQECNLNEVVRRSLSLVNYELIRGKVEVVQELAGDLPPLCLDLAKMEQVFINLYVNAIQAMPKGGTLTVRTSTTPPDAAQPALVAEVEDTGAGILESFLPRVFDPFFTTKPPGVGTGLGLPVTKKIIELHGGTIEIRNQPVGGVRAIVNLKLPSRS